MMKISGGFSARPPDVPGEALNRRAPVALPAPARACASVLFIYTPSDRVLRLSARLKLLFHLVRVPLPVSYPLATCVPLQTRFPHPRPHSFTFYVSSYLLPLTLLCTPTLASFIP